MTELTLEELQAFAYTVLCSEELNDLGKEWGKRCVAMARELIRIRSAIEHCAKHTGGRFPINVEELVETAKMFKWSDPSPPAELKGGEG